MDNIEKENLIKILDDKNKDKNSKENEKKSEK